MTSPVGSPSPADRAWAELGAELTPAKSLARVDAVTARAITTIAVIGVLLTGLGAVTAGALTSNGTVRALAVATVATAAIAVVCVLAAQVLTITRKLNTADLAGVEAWYLRQIRPRAYATQAATVLLVAAAILAGSAGVAALAASPAATPALAVTENLPPSAGAQAGLASLTVHVAFPGLAAGHAGTVVVASAGRVLARAAATGSGGTTSVALTVGQLAPAAPITVLARTRDQTCQATLAPGLAPPALTCRSR